MEKIEFLKNEQRKKPLPKLNKSFDTDKLLPKMESNSILTSNVYPPKINLSARNSFTDKTTLPQSKVRTSLAMYKEGENNLDKLRHEFKAF